MHLRHLELIGQTNEELCKYCSCITNTAPFVTHFAFWELKCDKIVLMRCYCLSAPQDTPPSHVLPFEYLYSLMRYMDCAQVASLGLLDIHTFIRLAAASLASLHPASSTTCSATVK